MDERDGNCPATSSDAQQLWVKLNSTYLSGKSGSSWTYDPARRFLLCLDHHRQVRNVTVCFWGGGTELVEVRRFRRLAPVNGRRSRQGIVQMAQAGGTSREISPRNTVYPLTGSHRTAVRSAFITDHQIKHTPKIISPMSRFETKVQLRLAENVA